MKNNLSCEVVNDLLPTYIDGLTSQVTNQAVESHLTNCKNCSEVLERMKCPDENTQDIDKQNIDFLKKTRAKSRQHITIGIIAAAVFVIVAFLVNGFFIGKEVNNSDLIQVEVTVSDRHIAIIGNLTDSGKGVAKVNFINEGGVVNVTISQALKSIFYNNDFYAEYDCDTDISEIWIEDRIIWEHGESIAPKVAKLYETRHPYIGDMSANSKTGKELGIGKYIGNYTNELQTTEEPYGWKLIGEQDYSSENCEKIKTQMHSYASVLIATIDNLGYVTYEYTVEGKSCTLTVTEQDADTLAGQSVKEMGKTAGGLQRLMNIVDLGI